MGYCCVKCDNLSLSQSQSVQYSPSDSLPVTDVALVNTLDTSLVVSSSSRSYFHPLGKPTSDLSPAVTAVYSDVTAARGQQESVGGSSSSSVMRGDIGIVICDVNSSGAADSEGSSSFTETNRRYSDDNDNQPGQGQQQLSSPAPAAMHTNGQQAAMQQQVTVSPQGTSTSSVGVKVTQSDSSLRSDVGDSATVNVTSVPSPELAKDKEREVMNSKPAMTDALTGASSAPHSNGKTSERKKKTSSWYNVLAPTYKSRCEEFKRTFKGLADEKLVVDYSCALQKDILVHGRLYVTKNYLCFYANIFKWETLLTIRFKDIVTLTKEKTARVIPNALQVCTRDDRYFFTSFNSRDKTFHILIQLWQLAQNDQPLSNQEFTQWVHQSYGDQLGLTSSDEEELTTGHSRHSSYEPCVTNGADKLEDEGSVNGHVLSSGDGDVDGTGEFYSTLEDGEIGAMSLTGSTDLGRDIGSASTPRKKTSANIITDHGESSDDEGEVSCSAHTHAGSLVLDDVFPVAVDTMFEFLFTDSPLFAEMCQARKWTDVSLQPWTIDSSVDGVKSRHISYTLPLNYSIGPKTSAMKERQTCLSESKARKQYIVDCECSNQGVPYSDSFYVVNRFCITRISANVCRLKVHSEIKYKKTVWGLVKTFIDRNVTQGVGDSFSFVADFLRQACSQVSAAPSSHAKKRMTRRRHRQTSTGHLNSKPGDELVLTEVKVKAQSENEEFYVRLNLDILVRMFAVVLIALVLVNGVLFYKLTSVEQLASDLQHQSADPLSARRQYWKQPGSEVDSEWSRLLMEQQRLQQAEVHRWRQVLFSSIQLVEQMQRTLRDLHDGVMRRADDIVALTEQAKRDIDLAGATPQQAEEAGMPS